MSWYEATTFDSISLCRSLVDGTQLAAMDSVLHKHGLGKLCREDYVTTIEKNPTEALAELEWLKTLLENVHDRSVSLGIPIKKKCARRPSANGVAAEIPKNWRERLAEQRERVAEQRQRREDHAPSPLPAPLPSTTTPTLPTRKPPPKKRGRPATPKPVEVWCICRGPSAGLMLACDNPKCPYEWFHASCVGLKTVPSSKWFCPICKPRIDRAQRARRRQRN